MTRQHHSWLLAPVLVGVALAARAGAQTSSEASTPFEQRSVSHRPLELPEGGTNPEELINNRLQRARGQYDVQKLAELVRNNPGLRKQLMQELGRLQKDGALPKMIDNTFDPNAEQLSPTLRSMLPQIIEQANIKLPETGSQEPSKEDIKHIAEKFGEQFKRAQEAGTGTQIDPGSMMRPGGTGPTPPPGQPPPPNAGSGGPDSEASPSGGPESRPGGETSRELVDFLARRFSNMDASSPSMQRALRSLERFKIEGDGRFLKLNQGTDKLKSALPDWVQSMRAERFRPERGWPFERGLKDVNFPRLRFSGNWFPSAPRVNLGAAGVGAAGAGTGLLYIVIIVVAGVILWKVLKLSRVFGAAGAANSWRLGPWPVNPAAVRTREEMVKAFEYLSLLLLGPSALQRNHLEIAAQMSGDPRQASVDRHLAVHHLAALYEQARYAPPNESLPEAELPAARRYLCYLAGVSHA